MELQDDIFYFHRSWVKQGKIENISDDIITIRLQNRLLIRKSVTETYSTYDEAYKALREKTKKRILHGHKNTKLYEVWCSIKQRCNNKNSKDFKKYGGRGIRLCDEWQNDFRIFHNWAISNGYREGLSIDRIDNNGSYEPSNCRWVDIKTQNNNTSVTLFYTLSEVSEALGINRSTLYGKLRNSGINGKQALRKVGGE